MKFLSLRNIFAPTTVYIIAQFNEKQLTLACGHINNDMLHITQLSTHELLYNEIQGTIICNPTSINHLVEQFTKQHKLSHPRLLISWPAATANPINLLQQALCLSKKLPIERFITKPLIPNQAATTHDGNDGCPSWQEVKQAPNLLDSFIPSNYHSLGPWLATSCAIAGVALYGIITTHTTVQHTLDISTRQCTQASLDATALQQSVKKTHELTNQNKLLQTHVKAISKTNHTATTHDFLITLANAIPEHSYLVNLSMGKRSIKTKKQKKEASTQLTTIKRIPLTFKGITYNPEEMSLLIKHLSEKVPHGQFALINLQKIHFDKNKATTGTPIYTFAVRGSIPT